MKTKLFMLCAIVCAIFLTCCEEEEPATSRKVETGKVSEITLTSATFHGVVNVDISQYNNVTFGIMLSDSKAELNERGGEMFKAKALIGTDFKIEIGNLETETKYYYCAWLFLNNTQYEFGEIKDFETQAPTLATVTTNPITEIMTQSAVAGGCVKDDGGSSVTERGIVYSFSKEPTTSNYKVKSGTGVGEFTCNLTNLQDNAIYYVRAYAINSKGTVYGEERYFTTKEITLPSVYTANVTDISYTSASISGNVTDDGNAEVTERGIVYSKTQNPTTSDTKKRNGSGTGSFTCNLTDLQDGVTYYVRAYATNLKGTAYGEEKSFTTKTINLPTVSTKTPSNISYTSATVDGYVSNDGGANVTERGIVYSTSKEPTTSNNKVKNGSGGLYYRCELSNLQDGVTYYVRAYATNLKGTAYGEEESFTTRTINLPTVSTSAANDISSTSAAVGGNVSNDGGATITERGIVYSTSQNPNISNSKIKSGYGMGSFACHLTDLQDNMTYYVRAYAINSKGVAYGEQILFKTKEITLPVVLTFTIDDVGGTTARISGNVINDGNATITERGIVYSTSQNPNTSNRKVKNGSGIGSFSCYLSDLQEGVTYYARAYAINSKGVAYGEEVSFTTRILTGSENSYTWVDLGLSVKWATCNVGANKPEEYGDYFAWGETEPKSTYSWNTYKWCRGSYGTLTKYCTSSSHGSVDNKTTLDLSDDAARANWGGSWRMPTDAELTELREQCTWIWTTQNGIYGYKVTSKKSGYTNKSIFLPAAGCHNVSSLNNAGSSGCYWSSSLYTGSPYDAYDLDFNSSHVGWSNYYHRYCGQSVRPVCP